MKKTLFVVAIIGSLFLAPAFGGGDDVDGAPRSTPTPDAPETPTQSIEERLAKDRQAIKSAVLESINQHRADVGLPPLQLRHSQSEVARVHSMDMIRKGYYNHTAPNGTTFLPACRPRAEIIVRVETVGFGADNTARKALDQWMSSESHRDIILDGRWSATGIGVGLTRDGKVYLTQNFC